MADFLQSSPPLAFAPIPQILREPTLEQSLPVCSDDIDAPSMTFSSSPVLYPPSSSPPVLLKKRKLFQSFQPPAVKKPRTLGGLLDENECQKGTVGKSVDAGNEDRLLESADGTSRCIAAAASEAVAKLDQEALAQQSKEDEGCRRQSLPPMPRLLTHKIRRNYTDIEMCSGKRLQIPKRAKLDVLSYEQIIGERSVTAAGRAKRSYYGVDIHVLLDQAAKDTELKALQLNAERERTPLPSVERPVSRGSTSSKDPQSHQMWTEKYRAKKFTELVGDERTHRSVLRWLKGWDSVVFPGSAKPKARRVFEDRESSNDRIPRKILLLTGPPGLGKTTLAHVCAKQAGYEVLEINASDDRSRDVVKGRIKDALGTENVRGIKEQGKARKSGRPVCVVVDEVDGVTSGSSGSGGEGGFMKALIDLVQLDQKNLSVASDGSSVTRTKGRKGDRFRMLRPLILICNDVYAPSLRPLRNSSFAEIVHVRRPPLDKVITRLKNVFEKENISCDNDAVRRLCESSWGLGTRKQNTLGARGAGDGDIRGVLVQGEWIAHKLRATDLTPGGSRLTRKWIESHFGETHAASGQKGLGRGGVREVVERVFLEGAGLPNLPKSLSSEDSRLIAESKLKPVGVADLRKRTAINALREMIDTCGDHDRLMTDCFALYPTMMYQDDAHLSKPNAGYDWLHFHDCLSSRIFSGQEWELNAYLNTAACGFHHLFAIADKGEKSWNDEKPKEAENTDSHPFSGPKADFAAYEATRQNQSVLTEFQSSFSAPLLRLFSSTDAIATELVPNLSKMLAPDVKPVVVGGSGGLGSVASVRKETEKACINKSVRIMEGFNMSFEKVRVEVEGGGAHSGVGSAYRMEPPLDTLTAFQFAKVPGVAPAPVRYAVRQVLSQELHREKLLQASLTRHARSTHLVQSVDAVGLDEDKENAEAGAAKKRIEKLVLAGVKRDFFGRIINDVRPTSAGQGAREMTTESRGEHHRVWISFNEGYSNAVRKPITLKELIESFEH